MSRCKGFVVIGLKVKSSKLKVQSLKSKSNGACCVPLQSEKQIPRFARNDNLLQSFGTRLELARLLARPALDHDFRFGEKFHRVASLAVENAEETLFPPAEGEIGHGRGDADIDADISRGRFVAEFARGGAACGEERCLVAVGTAAKKFHGFINRVGVNQTEHGTEDFRVGKLAGGRQSVKNRGRQEIS